MPSEIIKSGGRPNFSSVRVDDLADGTGISREIYADTDGLLILGNPYASRGVAKDSSYTLALNANTDYVGFGFGTSSLPAWELPAATGNGIKGSISVKNASDKLMYVAAPTSGAMLYESDNISIPGIFLGQGDAAFFIDDGIDWFVTITRSEGALLNVVLSGGAGAGATYSLVGNNRRGTITVNTGSSPQTNDCIAEFSIFSPYGLSGNLISMIITAGNLEAINTDVYCADSGGGVNVRINSGSTGLGAGRTYVWNYIIMPNY